MSPLTFIKSPPLWVHVVSRYKGTHLQAPNFAYILTSRKWDAKLKKDGGVVPGGFSLASVRHMFNAAEPVTAEACDAFSTSFAPYGFQKDAIVPGYGLAEHVVYVCDGGKGRLTVNKAFLENEGKVVVLETSETSLLPPDSVSHLMGCGFPSLNPDIDVVCTQ